MSVSGEARAYIAGLTRRLAQGEDVARIASLASFFVSRVDTTVDHPVEALGTERARHARGWAAIANAKMAYQAHRDIFEGAEFKELRAAGAHVQRCLWGSTSTKNPEYRGVRYVEELIGPRTVTKMPLETIEAFLDHGHLERVGKGEATSLAPTEQDRLPNDRVDAFSIERPFA